MATPESKTGVQHDFSRSYSSTLATGATTRLNLGVTRRETRFMDLGIVAQQTVTSGHPATNHFVAQLWNETDATMIASATISGTTSGTLLERNSFVSIATQSEFVGAGANASANKVIGLRVIGTGTLNRGIVNPHVRLIADVLA